MKYGVKYYGPCGNAEEYFSRGNFKKLLGDYGSAILDFNKAIELDPSFSEAYYQRGIAKTFINDEDGAVSDFNKAIDLILKIV